MHDGLVRFLEFDVHELDVDFRCGRPHLARLELRAKLVAAIPGPDDVVALHVEGAPVFAVPFGRFEPVEQHGAAIPGVFALKAHHLRVRIDFVRDRLAVEAEKVALPGYDASDGVEVELRLGDAVATDTVPPPDCDRDRRHHHHRCRHGHGHDGD